MSKSPSHPRTPAPSHPRTLAEVLYVAVSRRPALSSVCLCLLLFLSSCGTRSGRFRLEGRLLNLNQGQCFLYSPDNLIRGLDTIKIEGGRFSHEIDCEDRGTLILVFPNFSEQPIFAQSGTTATVKADASHLKEMTVDGNSDNKLMTAFRQQTAEMSPPDIVRTAEQYINDNPKSAVSIFLLSKYFLQDPAPDYTKALQLVEKLHAAQPTVARLNAWKQKLAGIGKDIYMPTFSTTDINGRQVSNQSLRGKPAVVYVWSTWNYDSQDIQRRIRRILNDHPGQLAVLGISLDASRRECRDYLRRDSLPWPIVCEERMFESQLYHTFGMRKASDNIVFDKTGRIEAQGLSSSELQKQIEKLLPKP